MAGEFQSTVQVRAKPKEVYDFLASGANTGMEVESSDPNAMKVSLNRKIGFFRYETLDCTVNDLRDGCRIVLKGRSARSTNTTEDANGTVMRLSDALVERFRAR